MISSVLIIITLLYILFSTIIYFLFNKIESKKSKKGNNIKLVFFNNQFLKYGFHRILSGIFLALIFFLPLSITSNYLTLEITAFLGVVIVIVRTLIASVAPLNILLLPYFSELKEVESDIEDIDDWIHGFCKELGIDAPK